MKLLTLEEIEEIQNDTDKIGETYINVSEMMVGIKTMQSLLALGRAYWELKNDPKTAQETSYHYIGQLRQWLNECRITDPSKMVDNKDIMEWLGIPVPEGYRTDKEVISEALGIKEDKPHACTIRAIVEALRESWEEGGERNNGHTVVFPGYKIDRAIKSLEKHLE